MHLSVSGRTGCSVYAPSCTHVKATLSTLPAAHVCKSRASPNTPFRGDSRGVAAAPLRAARMRTARHDPRDRDGCADGLRGNGLRPHVQRFDAAWILVQHPVRRPHRRDDRGVDEPVGRHLHGEHLLRDRGPRRRHRRRGARRHLPVPRVLGEQHEHELDRHGDRRAHRRVDARRARPQRHGADVLRQRRVGEDWDARRQYGWRVFREQLAVPRGVLRLRRALLPRLDRRGPLLEHRPVGIPDPDRHEHVGTGQRDGSRGLLGLQ